MISTRDSLPVTRSHVVEQLALDVARVDGVDSDSTALLNSALKSKREEEVHSFD